MLATFRNIAAITVTWYVWSFIADILAYGSQFVYGVVGDSDRMGSVILMHLVLNVPHIVVSVFAGAIAAVAVRPKGDVRWVAGLAGLLLLAYVISLALAFPIQAWSTEDFIGIILVSGLLVAGVHLGGSIIRRRLRPAA